MNGYITHLWKSVKEGGSLGNVGEFLNLKSLRNILFALNSVCVKATAEHGVGLLSPVGYDKLVDVEKLAKSHQVAGKINQERELKANDEQELLGKVTSEYDVMANYITEFIKNYEDTLFMRLTQVLLPCQDAHIAYAAVKKVACCNSGAISLLLGLVYVLALNVLFIALVYITLFNLAYAQARLVHLVNG
ncbi:hypothetical protein ACTXT7_015334 [Hymenolepis weldensis]